LQDILENEIRGIFLAQELSKCLELYEDRRDLYKIIELTIAAVRHDQSWHNLRTRILPSAKGVSSRSGKIIDLEDFVILHQKLNPNRFAKLLQDIKNNDFKIDGFKINFFNDQTPPLRLQDHYRGDSLRARELWNIKWPVDWYDWEFRYKWGDQLTKIFDEIDKKLRCYDPPYKDIEEATRDLLELPDFVFRHTDKDSRCIVLLPNLVAIEHVKLKGRTLEIKMRFHEAIDPKHILLSVIGYGRETYRYQENLEGGKIEKSPPYVSVSKSFKIKDVADAQLYVFSSKRNKHGYCDQRLVRNLKSILNPRIAFHEFFDESSGRLLQWLEGETKKHIADRFECAVVTLLHMCGFRTEWLDYHGMAQRAPDILAFCADPELVIVGECTTEMPDRNKCKTLKERADNLEAEFQANICPIIFTSVPMTTSERNEFWKYDVSLVTPETLRKLHDMASRAKPLKEILYVLTGRGW